MAFISCYLIVLKINKQEFLGSWTLHIISQFTVDIGFISICHDLKVLTHLDPLQSQGRKLTFFARSHLAPKYFKVIAYSKELGDIFSNNFI